MAKLYEANYQLVYDKKKDMQDLFTRMDNDRKLALLDDYEMKQLDGQLTPDVINVTMNEAMVYAGRCSSIMNGANMQRIVYGRELTDTDTTTIEEFYRDIYYANDLMLANTLFCSLYGFLIEQILLRGHIAARCLMRTEGDGDNSRFIPDIMPLDTRYFTYETDSQGMIWDAPDITRTKAQIERDYGITIRGKTAVVTDYWDDRVNEIYIATQLYKGGSQTKDAKKYPERPREHGLGYPPFVFQKSGAGTHSFMDTGGLKYQGESIFANNRGLIPELHRAASIMQTLTAMSFEGSYEYQSSEGTEAEAPSHPIYGLRKVIPTEAGAGHAFKLIPINDVKNASRLFYNMLVGALQRGGLPNIDFGSLSFPLSAVAIKRLQGTRDAIFIPRLNAMGLFYRSLSQMIKKQYVQAGYKVPLGEEGYEREYSKEDIDKKFAIKYEFHSVSPEQDIANTAIGQQQMALGLPRHYVYSNTLKVDDPDGLINQSRDERAEAGDNAITLNRRGRSMADKDGNFDEASGKDIEAEMILQQLEMVLRARAMGGTMGLEPQKGGIGAGQSMKPMVPLMDQEGGGGGLRRPPEEEPMMEPEEAERRGERREETVRRSRAEA